MNPWTKPTESIEDGSQQQGSDFEDKMLLRTPKIISDFAEQCSPPSSKRPRLHENELLRGPRSDVPLSVQTNATPRRFVSPLLAHPQAPSLVAPTSSAVASRPVFLKPPTEAQQSSEPLPEAFSPHRRGQKFVPGGIAAEVRQWVMDLSHHLPGSSAYRITGARGDALIVRVIETMGSVKDGMILVTGQFEGRVLRLLLPTAGKNRSVDVVADGGLLALKSLTWDVDIAGEKWIVGVDWEIISD